MMHEGGLVFLEKRHDIGVFDYGRKSLLLSMSVSRAVFVSSSSRVFLAKD